MTTYNYMGCWNDRPERAIQNYNDPDNPGGYVGNLSQQQCEQVAIQTGNSVYGLQYYGQCFVGNSLQNAQQYGRAFDGSSWANAECGSQGSSWTNQVYATNPTTMSNYQMSLSELVCYKNNNPDLANMNAQQLQAHWTAYGANEQRNNQCPSYQIQSGLYNYVGPYQDVSGFTFRANVNSIDECQQIANEQEDTIFALYNGSVCSTSNSNATFGQFNFQPNRNYVGPMGTLYTAQIYVRSQPFPPPPPPLPVLQNKNFSSIMNNNLS